MADQSVIKEVDHQPHPRRSSNPLMREQPEDPAMILTWRNAAHEVGVRVPADAWKHSDPES